VKEPDGFKLYYVSHTMESKPDGSPYDVLLCVLDSNDGVNWSRPSLGIYDYKGSTDNNIVMKVADNFACFYDENPACLPEEKYKAAASGKWIDDKYGLYLFTSPDGYHFKLARMMTNKGAFDTHNTLFWKDGKYICYIRDYHERRQTAAYTQSEVDIAMQTPATDGYTDLVRGICVMYSEDCVNWTEPKPLEFTDGLDYPLYTNQVESYERAPHVFVGFPTRYIERRKWSGNYEQMGGYERRWAFYNSKSPRTGLALTDTIFMCSRDGELWYRYNDSVLKPGYEHEHNWVYGDCFPAYKLVDSGDWFYNVYEIGYHRTYNRKIAPPLYRMKIRKDGFACQYAGGEERVLVTKPLIFEGNELHLNFETSAYGYIIIDVLDEDGNKLSEGQSFEVFGNNIDRRVMFEDGSGFSAYANKPVRLRFRMRDAKVYSVKFER